MLPGLNDPAGYVVAIQAVFPDLATTGWDGPEETLMTLREASESVSGVMFGFGVRERLDAVVNPAV